MVQLFGWEEVSLGKLSALAPDILSWCSSGVSLEVPPCKEHTLYLTLILFFQRASFTNLSFVITVHPINDVNNFHTRHSLSLHKSPELCRTSLQVKERTIQFLPPDYSMTTTRTYRYPPKAFEIKAAKYTEHIHRPNAFTVNKTFASLGTLQRRAYYHWDI
jgi:hypothetical protein